MNWYPKPGAMSSRLSNAPIQRDSSRSSTNGTLHGLDRSSLPSQALNGTPLVSGRMVTNTSLVFGNFSLKLPDQGSKVFWLTTSTDWNFWRQLSSGMRLESSWTIQSLYIHRSLDSQSQDYTWYLFMASVLAGGLELTQLLRQPIESEALEDIALWIMSPSRSSLLVHVTTDCHKMWTTRLCVPFCTFETKLDFVLIFPARYIFSVGWELSDMYTKEIATVHVYTYMGVHLAAHRRQWWCKMLLQHR